mmetsp:Transcript_27158/g.57074  ORF Transcript_27158/g.57074 Transcript_27158/m.57074 type:complete len:131 (+) Transcript_27158:836-1228(+)
MHASMLTHKCIRAHIRSRTNAQMHECTNNDARRNTSTLPPSDRRTYTYRRTQIQASVHPGKTARTHARTHTHTHTNTRTHARTRALSLSRTHARTHKGRRAQRLTHFAPSDTARYQAQTGDGGERSGGNK